MYVFVHEAGPHNSTDPNPNPVPSKKGCAVV